VKTLIPIVDRLGRRFQIHRVCIVADRGMISAEAMATLEEQGRSYILGARMRRQKEVNEQVLAKGGRFRVVHGPRQVDTDPAPLKVKEVRIEGRRYVVCVNAEEVEYDRAKREAIVASLREQLRAGSKSLVGNKGYRRYLKVASAGHFAIDETKLAKEARYDGTWVLRTNTELPAASVALQFKKLWMVEQWFRCCKSLLETRPIYHRRDETIRGHVFCSFLALALRHELQARLAAQGNAPEWSGVLQDLERIQYVDVQQDDKRFRLRTELTGSAGRVLKAVGVAAPPTVQQLS
jgi:transposase